MPFVLPIVYGLGSIVGWEFITRDKNDYQPEVQKTSSTQYILMAIGAVSIFMLTKKLIKKL